MLIGLMFVCKLSCVWLYRAISWVRQDYNDYQNYFSKYQSYDIFKVEFKSKIFH